VLPECGHPTTRGVGCRRAHSASPAGPPCAHTWTPGHVGRLGSDPGRMRALIEGRAGVSLLAASHVDDQCGRRLGRGYLAHDADPVVEVGQVGQAHDIAPGDALGELGATLVGDGDPRQRVLVGQRLGDQERRRRVRDEVGGDVDRPLLLVQLVRQGRTRGRRRWPRRRRSPGRARRCSARPLRRDRSPRGSRGPGSRSPRTTPNPA
jgi:hypothetical protein